MTVRIRAPILAAGVLTLIGCAARVPSVAEVEPFCLANVASFSNPEAGARGDFSANVLFADIKLNPDSVGYGAAQGRSDEITIADGILHLARPDGAGGHRERTAVAGEGGYMLQLVSPLSWRKPVRIETVATIDELGAILSRAVAAAGCNREAKLAYRFSARVAEAEWSLDTLPQRGDFTTADEDAVIVGLFATIDQAKHFVTPGRNIHAHVVFPRLGVAGHLKSIRLPPGGILSLQGG